jgi:phytoene/squalene synthetase
LSFNPVKFAREEEIPKMTNTAALARSITWSSSRHSYLTARLLADRDLVDDCLRAYAYFRWADDMIDVSAQSSAERIAFITRQKVLVENLYQGNRPMDICPQEEMLADLVTHDRGPDSGLRSFILNFMAVIEFDALRAGRLVTRRELSVYTTWLATAVMDGIQYFIGNGHPYPKTVDRTQAVVGAHLVHMLRDTMEDIPAGIINIPVEDIQGRGIKIADLDGEVFRLWILEQVERARYYLLAGKGYIDRLDVLRCKLAGVWYCARFEWYLNAIQRDGYRLRRTYPECQNPAAFWKMVGLGFIITLRHFAGKFQKIFPHPAPGVAMGSEGNTPSYRVK